MYAAPSRALYLFPSSSPVRQITTLAAAVIILFVLFQSWNHDAPTPLQGSKGRPQTHLQLPDEIPKQIWYKLGAKGLSHDAVAWVGSCLVQNPQWAAHFLTDEAADRWVSETFSHRPELVATYLALQVPILKADWLRYLLLYAEGGMWSDLDVSCNSPIESWIPAFYKNANISLIVGWEFDTPWEDTGEALHELATWTVVAKPGTSYMLTAVEGVLQGVLDVARENGVDVAGITATPPMMGDIVTFCGPRRMTASIFGSLQRTLGASDEDFEAVMKSTWFLLEPKLVGDVLILPGFAFSRLMNTYDEQVTASLGPPLVEHHYAGSWKNEKGGE